MSIKPEAATPAKHDLFTIDDTALPLPPDEADALCSVAAKLLSVAVITRARMDLLLAIGFLSTRVTKSTKQDQDKL